MNLVVLATLSMLVVMASAKPYVRPPPIDINNAKYLFQDFIKTYDKHYKDDADKEIHYQRFIYTLKLINESNAASTSAVFGINKFADYTTEELKSMLGYIPAKKGTLLTTGPILSLT